MAAKFHEAAYQKYLGEKAANVSNETTEEEIKCIYAERSPVYDKQSLTTRVAFRKPLAECLDDAIKQVFQDKAKDEIKIIDAGAGTGLVGIELYQLGYTNLYALDISQEMLNEAKKKNLYKQLICAPLNDQRVPEIETGEFDALICGGTLYTGHVRSSAFVEMVRMVRIGGLICFNIRVSELDDYQGMMLELEKTETWSLLFKKTVPYFGVDDLPKETLAFVYKVLKN
ncbi:hypothetical protein ACROYT_G025845 [Oculina patagonica]